MLFVKEHRPLVADTMPELKKLHIMKEVGRRWGRITPAEMRRFKKLAEDDLIRFQDEHKEYIEKINDLRHQAFSK